MAGDQYGDSDLVKLPEELHNFSGQFRVQIPGRFICEKQGWPVDNGSGDTDPLLFSPREGDGILSFLFLQTDFRERRPDPPACFARVISGNHQRQCYIVKDCAIEQQLVILENHPDIPSHCRNLSSLQSVQVFAINKHLALTGSLHQDDQLQQCAFPGTGVAGEKRHLLMAQFKTDVA